MVLCKKTTPGTETQINKFLFSKGAKKVPATYCATEQLYYCIFNRASKRDKLKTEIMKLTNMTAPSRDRRHTQTTQFGENETSSPIIRQTMEPNRRVGLRPHLSANGPASREPTAKPMTIIDWERSGRISLAHTRSHQKEKHCKTHNEHLD